MKIITEKVKVIEVSKEDLPRKLTWSQAKDAGVLKGENWRLPTVNELEAMHDQLHAANVGNFRTDGPYWISEEEDDECAWPFDFTYTPIFSEGKDDLFYVRLVRDCV
jgi:hypothetical protein